jgi:hypothetical protein
VSKNSPRVGRRGRVTRPDIWYFDQLPPTAREALSNAAFDWSSGAMFNRWQRGARGYKTGKEIAERVRAADKSVKPAYLGGEAP